MIFQARAHYDLDDIYSESVQNTETDVCFICYEIGGSMVQLQTQSLYITHCTCNSHVHECCLYKWTKCKQQCPICHINVIMISHNQFPTKKQLLRQFLFQFSQVFSILYILATLYKSIPAPT